MSSTSDAAKTATATDNAIAAPNGTNDQLWATRARQTMAIFGLEVRNNFLSRRALLLYLIAASPLVLLTLFALVRTPSNSGGGFSNLHSTFAGIYGALILRTLVFFGCAWVFMNLFRGEVIDRSLHYYFLTPVRREVLILGKYLAGLATTVTLFSVTTAGSMLILYFSVYPKESVTFFAEGRGASQLLAYLAVTILGCVGYGAVFMLVGLFFRNPVIPGLLLYGWEFINFLLPPVLKKLSVIHYLHSLVPVPLSQGPFAVLAEPTPAWLSIPGLFLFTGALLFIAGRHIRRMEIAYAAD